MRRVHVPKLQIGEIVLSPAEAHHARDVLRLEPGSAVEVFDDQGALARGVLQFSGAKQASVRVERIENPGAGRFRWSVAAAVPKGDRADWMVEKLSELGTSSFIPLATARSVVLPEGKNKIARWARLATESAKQSRRRGIMNIRELMRLHDAVELIRSGEFTAGWYLSTQPSAKPVREAIQPSPQSALLLFIGPEGGWTEGEIALFEEAGLTGVGLTATILRIETAAIAAAAVVGSILAPQLDAP